MRMAKIQTRKGTSKKAIESLGFSNKDLIDGKISCADIDKKTTEMFKGTTTTSAKRGVNTARDISNKLLVCELSNLTK